MSVSTLNSFKLDHKVRIEAYVTNFLYNSTQKGWCETRVINNTLDLRFVGSKPMVFKPGMPLDAQIAVRFADQVGQSNTALMEADG